MARRNRRKTSEGFTFPVPIASLFVLGAIVALSYLWLDSRCETLEDELRALEEQKQAVRQRFSMEESKWAEMKTSPYIRKALRRHGLHMSWPDEAHVVRVYLADSER